MNDGHLEYAETIPFPVQWDIGAPLPCLLANDYRTYLTFYVRVPDPDWDGTYVTVKDPAADSAERLALVEFHHCAAATLGDPNDEVLSGHPLYKHGLEAYTAQVVRNSSWLKRVESINAVHPQYRPERWRGLLHYILWFHDSTFECLAESFTVRVYEESMAAMLERVSRLLLGNEEGNA